MKPSKTKQDFIRLRAEGKSLAQIAKILHIGKSTCGKWEKELESHITQFKRDELNALYEAYNMKKQAKIKRLGDTLNMVEDALSKVNLAEIPPEKLLDYKLKYLEALGKEYINVDIAFKPDKPMNADDMLISLNSLLNRIQSGEISPEQANKESIVLSNMIKAYEQVEIKTKLNGIEVLLEELKCKE